MKTCPRCAIANRPEARFCRGCGADLAEVATDPAPPAAPTEADRPDPDPQAADDRRKLVRRVVVLLGVIAVLVIGYGGFVTIRDTLYPPERPVRALFEALESRDAAAIDDLVGCASALCTADGLRSGYTPPTDFDVENVEILSFIGNDPNRRPNTSMAVVSVRYTLGDVTHHTDINVQRASGGLFREWRVSTPPGSYVDVVSLTMAKARLANAEVDTTRPPQSGFIQPRTNFALVGVYTVTAVDNPLLSTADTTLVVTGDTERARVDLTASIKPTALPEVDRQIKARIDACVPQPTFSPRVDGAGCYFDHNTKYAFTDKARWTLVDYPTVELRLTEDAMAGTGGVSVHTVTPGHANIDYEYTFNVIEPRQWTPTSGSEEITPRGGVVVTDGKVTWTG